jgi:hypothetical protein
VVVLLLDSIDNNYHSYSGGWDFLKMGQGRCISMCRYIP